MLGFNVEVELEASKRRLDNPHQLLHLGYANTFRVRLVWQAGQVR